jgi:2-polyprenyl-3-methyl-5-hydroxy-6-metoxy-1,4-benzoquinol methylase
MSSTSWDKFWKDQRQSFYAVMRIATNFCVSQIDKRYQLKATDNIFDYGCGPGFVADALAAKNIGITGADINEFFLEECRKNHPAARFILITTDITTNKKILEEQLKAKKFDYIVLLSVAQYLNSVKDLEDIIALLRSFLKEQGKIIVADILDENTSAISDAFSLLKHCIRKGRIGAFIGFIFYLLFSNYRKITSQINLLQVPEQAIQDIAKRTVLQYEKVKGLTIHPTRTNYVFTLPSQNTSV